MNPNTKSHPAALIWSDQERIDFISQILTGMNDLDILAIGGPKRSALTQLADSFNADCKDDLRKMLIEYKHASFLLLGTSTGVNVDLLKLADEHNIQVIALEPPVGDVTSLPDESPQPGKGCWWWPAPWWQLSPAWLSAAEPKEMLGDIKSLSIINISPPSTGSLYARLYDTFDMLLTLSDMPVQLDAALISPLSNNTANLKELTGHFTCMIRLRGQQTAVIHASDQSVVWQRSVTCIGDHGQLSLTDNDYALWHKDDSADDEISKSLDTDSNAAVLCIKQWKRMIEHRITYTGADPRQVIACCHAALLSTRTGAPESPESMMHLAGM